MSTQTTVPSIPHDIPAEEAVLGSLLISPDALMRLPGLKPADFYRGRNGLIYEIMQRLCLRGDSCDIRSISSELERIGKIEEIGGASYLAGLVNATPSAAFVAHYARRVEHCAVCRRVISAAGKIAADAYQQPEDLDGLLASAEAMLYDVRRDRNTGKVMTPLERAGLAAERYQRRSDGAGGGIRYGLLALDRWTQGAEPGQLIAIGGRPGSGKTSLLYNIAESMAQQGKVVLICSAEMPEAQLTDRAVSGRTGITMHRLQQGDYGDAAWQAISEVLGQLGDEPMYLYDDADMTTAGIRTAAVEMRSRYGLDAVFIDYLQILHDKARGNEVERVTGISRALKAMARGLSVPVIVAAQLSRAVEHRDDKHPRLSDLRESGSIEQDCDLVVFIYRAGLYNNDPNDMSAELIIAKQRNGPAGVMSPLIFDKRVTKFRDAETQRESVAAPRQTGEWWSDHDAD